MTVEDLANAVIDACESSESAYMLTGAVAFNYFGLPRATTDVDVVLEVTDPNTIQTIVNSLEPIVKFGGQVQFDTLTWGRRHIGRPIHDSILSVELFELFGDPFVMSQFSRRQRLFSQGIHHPELSPTSSVNLSPMSSVHTTPPPGNSSKLPLRSSDECPTLPRRTKLKPPPYSRH